MAFSSSFPSEPLQHFYFWLKTASGTISWSRDASGKKNPQAETRVLEVYGGPSNALTNNSHFSLNTELYKNVFSVMTDRGVLDLMAYNEEACQQWLRDTARLAQRNREEDELQQSQLGVPTQPQMSESVPTSSLPQLSSSADDDDMTSGTHYSMHSGPSGRSNPSDAVFVAESVKSSQNKPEEMDDSCGDDRQGGPYHSDQLRRTSLQELSRRPSSQPHPPTSTPNAISMVTNETPPNAGSLLGQSSLVLLDDII